MDDRDLAASTIALGDAADATPLASHGARDAHAKRTVTLLASGTVVDGDYRIERLVGVGGMGVVYLARDLRLDRDVALKVHNTVGRTAALRLAREATAMARVTHPNVVAVHRVGELDGSVFVAMEYVSGGTLRTWARDRSVAEIVAAYADAGAGLAAAHAAGLVHRDFKPDNVLIGADGRPRVTDFGLAVSTTSTGGDPLELDGEASARPSGDLVRLTMTGAWVGTPAYMAPEQWDAGALDPRSDQFSFCVALWEALHGQRPFRGDKVVELRDALRAPPRPAERGKVPRHLDAALRRGLAPDVDARFPSMDALVTALRHDPAARRRRWIAGGLVAALATIAVIATVSATRRDAAAAPCADDREIEAVWNRDRGDRVAAAFAALGGGWAARAGERTTARLEARALAWTDVAIRTCKAARITRTWTDELYARARRCLIRRRGELDGAVTLLAAGDPVMLQRALDLVDRLPLAADCGDPARLERDVAPPGDPTAAAAVAEVEARLDAELADALAGRYEPAQQALDAVASEVARLEHPPLTAELAIRRADLASRRGDDDSHARNIEAYLAARRAGLAVPAVERALAAAIASARDDLADAMIWWQIADAEVTGLSLGPREQAMVARARAAIADAQGDLVTARAEAARALRLLTSLGLGDDAPEVLEALDSLGAIEEAVGDYSAAVAHGQRVIAGLEQRYGPDHPRLVSALSNLGLSLTAAGLHADAEAALERSLALARATLPPTSLKLAYSLLNLGVVRIDSGKAPEAISVLREAVAVLVAVLGEDHADTSLAVGQLGLALMQDEQYAEATAALERALASTRASIGPDTSQAAVILHNLGVTADGAGDSVAGLRYLEQSLAIYRLLGQRTPDEAKALTDLAGVLLALRRPEQAAMRAREAIAMMEGTGIDLDVLARAELLLARGLWDSGERAGARAAAAAAATHAEDASVRAAIAEWTSTHR